MTTTKAAAAAARTTTSPEIVAVINTDSEGKKQNSPFTPKTAEARHMGQQTLRPTHGFGGFGAPVGSHSALAARITVLIVRIAAGQRLSGRNANIQQVYQLVGVSDFMWVPAGRYVLTQGYVLWRKPFRPPQIPPKTKKLTL